VAKLYVGLSGYAYRPWQGEGRFYPADLKQREYLSYYSERFPAVEMDGSWYRLPSDETIAKLIDGSPQGFHFSFKAHRNITHIGRLKVESLGILTEMLKRAAPMELAGKLACIFFQLPPNMKRNDERLRAFLEALPPGHSYAVEFRNETWFVDEVDAMLREFGVAWVSWDTDEIAGQRRDTASFLYARLRRSTYTDEQLAGWVEWFRNAVAAGKDCFLFFKHEDEGSPWIDANRLLAMWDS
jgi:uncharacterized protein YecE (DUF72 family)